MNLKTSAAQILVDQVIKAEEPHYLEVGNKDHHVILLKDGSIHSLEKFGSNRVRFRGHFNTASLKDFGKYVKDYAQPLSKGFIDSKPDSLSASVYFNIGDSVTPGHADWLATLTPKKTEAYAFLSGLGRLDQKRTVELLEDWASLVTLFANEKDLNVAGALAAVRKVTITATSERTSEEQVNDRKKSTLETAAATSPQSIPDLLTFTCKPFDDFQPRPFVFRLSVITTEKEPVFQFRWQNKESQMEEIAQEFKQLVVDEVGTGAGMYVGTFNKGQ